MANRPGSLKAHLPLALIAVAMLVTLPLLAWWLGPVAVCVLSIAAYRQFARGTGLFRWPLVSGLVGVGIVLVCAANLWGGSGHAALLGAAVPVLVVALSTMAEPRGYIQRCALGASAFLLFGVGLGRLGWLTAQGELLVLAGVVVVLTQFVDLLGAPYTPGPPGPRTVMAVCVGFAVGVFAFRFMPGRAEPLAWAASLALAGAVALLAPAGGMVLASVTRDLNIQPHGPSLADRAAPLMLSAPAVYHLLPWLGLAQR